MASCTRPTNCVLHCVREMTHSDWFLSGLVSTILPSRVMRFLFQTDTSGIKPCCLVVWFFCLIYTCIYIYRYIYMYMYMYMYIYIYIYIYTGALYTSMPYLWHFRYIYCNFLYFRPSGSSSLSVIVNDHAISNIYKPSRSALSEFRISSKMNLLIR